MLCGFAWRFAVLCSVVLGLFCFWFGAPLLLLGCWCCSVVELPASPPFLWRCAFVVLWFCLAFCSPLQRRSRLVMLLVWCASSVVRVLVLQRGRAASLASLLVALCFRCSVVFAWRFAVLCSVVLGLLCFWFGAPLLLLGCWCCSVVELPASPPFLWRCAFVVLWFLLGVLQSFAASFSACFASGLVRLFCC